MPAGCRAFPLGRSGWPFPGGPRAHARTGGGTARAHLPPLLPARLASPRYAFFFFVCDVVTDRVGGEEEDDRKNGVREEKVEVEHRCEYFFSLATVGERGGERE